MDSKSAVGIVVTALGLTIIVGSVTANLAGMLAALFDPLDGTTTDGSSSKPTQGSFVNSLKAAVGDVVNPIGSSGIIKGILGKL